MNTEQMELKLARSPKLRLLNRRRNLSRASWWFTQMRNAVSEAREWPVDGGGESESQAMTLGGGKH